MGGSGAEAQRCSQVLLLRPEEERRSELSRAVPGG